VAVSTIRHESFSFQLVRDLLIQDLMHGERDDDLAGLLEEAADFSEGIAGVIEGEIEPSRRRDSRER